MYTQRQRGGAGQHARFIGYINPIEVDPETGKDVAFESVVMGGNIPSKLLRRYFDRCSFHRRRLTNFFFLLNKSQGFYEAVEKGTLSGNPITGYRLVLKDGTFHDIVSSELAFRLATIGAFREIYRNAKPVILEPIMNVEVVAPDEFQSASLETFSFLFSFSIFERMRPDRIIFLQAKLLAG